MQRATLTLTSSAAARALRDTPFLSLFLEPVSPSEVARRLGQPANLVHHHVRRLMGLGLLITAGRRGNRHLYQLAAREFRYDRGLLGTEAAEGQTMRRLEQAFVRAFERSDTLAQGQDPDFAVHSFSQGGRHPDPSSDRQTPEGHPAHLHIRSVHLTPGEYQGLVHEFYSRLAALNSEDRPGASPCTFALLAFAGTLTSEVQDVRSDFQQISSFVPLRQV